MVVVVVGGGGGVVKAKSVTTALAILYKRTTAPRSLFSNVGDAIESKALEFVVVGAGVVVL